jgi:hypothetical protein
LLVALGLALAGCSAMKIKMGWRVDLTKVPVASIELSLPKGPAIAPGKKSPLVVKVTLPDGKVLLTEGQGGGKVQWKDLAVQGEIVAVNNKGVVSLPKDPRMSDGRVGHVTVTVPSHPDVHAAELDIPFRYDVKFTANFFRQQRHERIRRNRWPRRYQRNYGLHRSKQSFARRRWIGRRERL